VDGDGDRGRRHEAEAARELPAGGGGGGRRRRWGPFGLASLPWSHLSPVAKS
jgi:hypothetical protein